MSSENTFHIGEGELLPLSDSFKNQIQSSKERVKRVATIILVRNVRCGEKNKSYSSSSKTDT